MFVRGRLPSSPWRIAGERGPRVRRNTISLVRRELVTTSPYFDRVPCVHGLHIRVATCSVRGSHVLGRLVWDRAWPGKHHKLAVGNAGARLTSASLRWRDVCLARD